MRAAPIVDAALAAGRAERAAVLLLHLVAAVALMAWVASWRDAWGAWLPGWPQQTAWAWPSLAALGLLAAAVLGRWQALGWLPQRPRRLRWNGQAWACVEAGRAVDLLAVSVQIDLGPWLLLRLQPAAPSAPCTWAVARARAAGADWHALRVALQHHAGHAAPAGAGLGPTSA